MSTEIRVVRLKMGFYRIYYRQAYIAEVYKEMPEFGYDIEELDPRLENQSYYEEYEDNVEITRKVKNFVEGYWEALDTIRTRLYLMRNNKDYNEQANLAYRQLTIK